MTNNKPALAHYADKPLTPVIADYVAWLKAETGYEVDPMSVALSSALRGVFQKSPDNQQRIADAAERNLVRAQERADRQKARAEKAGAERWLTTEFKLVQAPPTPATEAAAPTKAATAKSTPTPPARRRPAKAAE